LHVYAAHGASGEVLRDEELGSLRELVQLDDAIAPCM